MQHHPQQQKLVKKEHIMFTSSDLGAIMRQVVATHSPDGQDMDLEPILRVIEETLRHAIPASFKGANDGTHDGHVNALAGDVHGIPDDLARVIHKISCEFSCKCSGGADAHASTMAILNMLSGYTWEAKMVISLGALSVNVGEFWLLAQLVFVTNPQIANPLAKSLALLKRLPDIIGHYKSLEPRFKVFNDLIKAMLDVTKCIIEIKKLPDQYLQYDGQPELTDIPTAAYSCITSMVACAAQLTSLLGMDCKYMATKKAWVALDLADMVYKFHKHLKELIVIAAEKKHDIAAEKKHDAHSLETENIIEPLGNLDIINDKITTFPSSQFLNTLFGANPLFHASSMVNVDVNVLSEKNVLLLISDLDISHEKVRYLNEIYGKKQPNHQYEVVWVPIVDDLETWNDSHQDKLVHLRSMMEWYVLEHPESLDPAVIRYLKQEWHFEKEPILVVLDQQGRVTSKNALHMVWIWQNMAYPFTSIIERDLWKRESWTQSWTLELLVDSKDGKKWIAEKKHICLYGGDNLLWIREFIKLAAEVAQAADIQLQMVYVGKRGTEERITKISAKIREKISATISEKKLSYTWTEPPKVWYYWTRLENMLYSKIQHAESYENDQIMQELMTMMSFDLSGQGWALICNGSSEMARANADLGLQSLEEYKNWEVEKKDIGFVPALTKYLKKLHKSEHCNRLILPRISGWNPKGMKCLECGQTMEQFFMFCCCTD